MTPLTAAAAALTLLAAGYTIGRYRPVHRVLIWANWQRYDPPTGLRHAAAWTVLSVENLAWLAIHPVRGREAWKHRNDPPPPRSPAVRIIDNPIPDRTVNEEG
ncbi:MULTISPECIES: hypothetical protein [unclassified Streptomyces]|uniref:hypothetical protein n=1 Tax=unclassified Streptomyces TaxID=2593676 RepID=UPI001F1A5FDF|nr:MULTISPECIES: hypothetical protein [unclassified Streptomyces]MCF0086678.1 hypothetical protein [Streptomyces sp. MH192]MCF0098832.1 hypothetical protein [Streptomyces sp. MH191]